MKIPAIVAAELRRLTSTKMAILALIALMCVPIIYGALYLWANQDPYAKVKDVPVAIAMEDEGYDGTNMGRKVAQSMLDKKTFDYSEVSEAQAERGVKNGDFDFSITFPKDFSRTIQSSSTTDPEKAVVVLTTNDANSYLATTIGKNAIATIKASITEEVNKQAAMKFLVAISDIRGNLVKAVDASGQLNDGAIKLADAAHQAKDGADTLHNGASQLADGTGQLATGASTLSSGLNTLDQQTAALPQQTQQLANGAQQVADGNAQIAAKADRVGSVANQAANALPQVRQDIANDLAQSNLSPEAQQRILSRLDGVGSDLKNQNQTLQGQIAQIDKLSAGANQVAAGAKKLSDSAPALHNGIHQAASGASQLNSGAQQAHSGAVQLSDGSQQLSEGLGQLSTGADQLKDGMGQLDSGLRSGLKQIPETTADQRERQASNIAEPVKVNDASVASAGSYGAGLAPFFSVLAAWIGIYALFLIVRPVSKRAITSLHGPFKVGLAGWLTPAMLGVIQMVGLFAVVALALKFPIDSPLATYGVLALCSITFAAIVLALNIWLGSVGQFLGLVLMVLQLVTAGGTFPWQTLPGPLAALHHVLPMSFGVDAMRQTMYGGLASAAWTDIGYLLLWLGISLALSVIGVARMMKRWTLHDLQPSLIGG